MSDVTAMVLSVGEETTERAIESVRRQTLAPAEIVVVRGISPWYRAFDEGAARVRTEFFVQVDADMVLDETCLANLRACISDGVGVVVGNLRDPLLGRVVGVKLFRTRCCDLVKHRDSTSPETEFIEDLHREGWTRISALKYAGGSPDARHAFGEHRPDYTPLYAFCKYVREGAKARYRMAGGGLRRRFRQLQASGHGAAIIATIASAHGIFVREARDLHGPPARSDDFERLERFLGARDGPADPTSIEDCLASGDLGAGFKRAYALGIRLHRRQAPTAFRETVERLGREDGIGAWVATVGLCHGLFADEYREADAEEAFALLAELLPKRR